jgi:hypothetical protein
MQIIPFHHYILFSRNHVFPRVKGRFHLVQLFTNGISAHDLVNAEAEANQLWTEYVDWHCGLRPVNRHVSFKTWAKSLRTFDNEHERAFVRDIDDDFPPGLFDIDYYIDYLSALGAIDEAIDAFERLWIKYRTED